MKRRTLTKSASAILMTSLLLTGCGAASTPAANSPNLTPTQMKDGKFTQEIELSIGRSTHSTLSFDPGESYDKNSVYDAYDKNLGIKLTNLWVVDPSQYDQKVGTSIASNQLPDLLQVSAVQMQQMVNAGEAMDLTELFNKYATPETKKFFSGKITSKQFNTAKFDGKLMAIPFTDSPYNFSTYVYVRQDWLNQLHLPAPKTMEDLVKLAQAFATQRPGGASKTYGLALTSDLYNDVFGLKGVFNGYHAYPEQWIKDSSGKLAYGSIQPEMKLALKQLQDMYKAGLIDPEFSVKTPEKETELVSNNQIGIAYGKFWLTSYPLKQTAIKNGKVTQEWATYPLLSVDDKPAMTQVPLGLDGYYVVSKNCKHPEAVMALVNQRVKLMEEESQGNLDAGKPYSISPKGNDQYGFLDPMIFYNPDDRLKDGEVFPKAIQNSDPSVLSKSAMGEYNNVQSYLHNGKLNYWNAWMQTKPGGSLSIMTQYGVDNRYLLDEFNGPPTPTMAQKLTSLQATEQEEFTKIIMNQAPVDEFDKFVKNWKALGGDTITKEVNDWYNKQSK